MHEKIATRSFGWFSDKIHSAVLAGRIPLDGGIEITYRCNIQCEHCYIPHRSGRGELTTDEWKGVLDEATEAGALFLLISGGEPFLRPDALEIFRHAKENGLLVTIFTNGTMITPEIAEELHEYPPFSMEVSIYGMSAQSYETVAKVPKAFERVKEGIKLLAGAGVPLSLKTVALTLNRDDLPKMEAFAAELGLSFRFDATVHPRLDGNKAPKSVRLSPEEVVELDRQRPERLSAMRELQEKFKTPSDPARLFQCGAGKTAWHVDPFGQLMLCQSVATFKHDLRTSSFREGWEHYVAGVLALADSKRTRCHECELHALCGQCPAWSLMENGTLDDPVDYLCDITAARAEAMGIEARPPRWTAEARSLRSERAARERATAALVQIHGRQRPAAAALMKEDRA